MIPVNIGRMTAPQKRTIQINTIQILQSFMKGKGHAAQTAINPKNIRVGNAFGDSLPPKL